MNFCRSLLCQNVGKGDFQLKNVDTKQEMLIGKQASIFAIIIQDQTVNEKLNRCQTLPASHLWLDYD